MDLSMGIMRAGPPSAAAESLGCPDRRTFLCQAVAGSAGLLLPRPSFGFDTAPADYTLEIAETDWEIAPKKRIRTVAYNGQIPGPTLKLTEGKPVTIDIVNRLTRAEIVHWHGQWVPVAADGAMEEGSPMIPAGGRTRITFTPRPVGLHWYHTHASAGHDLKFGLYSGQFGALWVEPRAGENPCRTGNYDQEHFLLLHEWLPYAKASDDGSMEVAYVHGTVNAHVLGAGNPIRVQQGQRVLLHIVNASATLPHWLSLPGHTFEVLAMDGQPVPTRAKVPALRLGPAERVSCVVEMDHPGVWVLGETDRDQRSAGMGIVVEYAHQTGKPREDEYVDAVWDYRIFGDRSPVSHAPDYTIPLVFTSKFRGHGAMDRWFINGKSYPDYEPVVLHPGKRHRLIFDNRSRDDHPIHLHRHAFEVVSIAGAATSGVYKDVVMVKAGTKVEADLVADNPGATLFHCHQQDHMDEGFMTVFRYAAT